VAKLTTFLVYLLERLSLFCCGRLGPKLLLALLLAFAEFDFAGFEKRWGLP
jgi:hypothetical protein